MLGITPTQLEADERSKAFHAKIAERAAALIPAPKPPRLVSDEDMREACKLPDNNQYGPKIESILRAVSDRFKVSYVDIISARRTAKVVLPRQIAMYLAKNLTTRSLPEIGRRIGQRDHTTILSGVNKINRLRQIHPEMQADIDALTAELTRE